MQALIYHKLHGLLPGQRANKNIHASKNKALVASQSACTNDTLV